MIAAAHAVFEQQRTPGTQARADELADALRVVREEWPELDVLVSAGVWLDRHGKAGAPERLTILGRAIERIENEAPAS